MSRLRGASRDNMGNALFAGMEAIQNAADLSASQDVARGKVRGRSVVSRVTCIPPRGRTHIVPDGVEVEAK